MSPANAVAAKPIRRQKEAPLVDVILERLERMILNGEFAAGSKLNEHTLSQQFGVSRSALREAARLLQRSGLVEIEAGRGVLVRKIGVRQAMDLFDVRAGFARSAGRLAARRATEDQITDLKDLHKKMVACRAKLDFKQYVALNAKFHDILYEAAANERLTLLNEMISNELQLFHRINMARAPHLDISIQEHARILEYLEQRDGEKTAKAFERHILQGRQRMLDVIPASLRD